MNLVHPRRWGGAVLWAVLPLAPVLVAADTTPADLRNQGSLALPVVGETALRLLTPTCLELRRIGTKAPDPARVDRWDWVDATGKLHLPGASEFTVTVDGRPVAVVGVGFRRRPIYAAMDHRDLRIDNALILQLAAPVADGRTVVLNHAASPQWPAGGADSLVIDPLRDSPVLHVNQEGYAPSWPKRAMAGYYLGSLGELDLSAAHTFRIINAATAAVALEGELRPRRDHGYDYRPAPYQGVLEADFSALTAPGEYRLVVPGLGASRPFLVDEGVPLAWLRTYALGLYHQRCGAANALPYSRFEHAACHLAPAAVPTAAPAFAFTWATIASKNADFAKNPRHTAPQLRDAASQLYPFVNPGPIDTTGGHHDAGDYSKYTINSAALVHLLMFTVDAFPAVGALDNLGLPESGDGIGDLLQEAKWESDYLAKLQDADGGFYFIVYPRDREYEDGLSLSRGDPQVVWPKNTAATAAAVAALAQCASSPAFRKHFPVQAAAYLERAKRGWQFLEAAIAKHGRDGAYQEVTFYGDEWMHDDELAWAACELYLATGEPSYQARLFEWFPQPGDSATFHWGWRRMSQSWGNAIRSYAFAARTHRLPVEKLDAIYLQHCEQQVLAAADDVQRWSEQNAYGTSFPSETKRFHAAGWYFSLEGAADIAAGWLIDPKPAYVEAVVANLNFEGGTNPVNVTYVTGLGQRRQREVVSQYARADHRVFAPTGIPLGNIQNGFDYLAPYGLDLKKLTYPSNDGDPPYPFYDRWADIWSVSNEFVTVNQARSILALSVLVAPVAAQAAPWRAVSGSITVPAGVAPVGAPVTLRLEVAGLDLAGARIVWESRDQEPAFGSSFTVIPRNGGPQWVEAEATWPDGRRVFARASFPVAAPPAPR